MPFGKEFSAVLVSFPVVAPSHLIDVRCPGCRKLLFRAAVPLGVPMVRIEIICSRCHIKVEWPDLTTAYKKGED